MTLLKGESINLGIGIEDPATRGTFVVPQNFIPARTPSGVNVKVTKALLKETKSSGIASQGSTVVQRMAGGDLEFNVRSESIGYLLKSLLGAVASVVKETTAYNHTFTVLPTDPQFPSISLALAQSGQQDYAYNGAIVKSIELKTPVDDLVNAKVEFIAKDEAEHTDFTPAFQADDYIFRPQDITIKLATNLAGLDAANAINVKELELSIDNSARPQQCLGSVTPTDNIAQMIEITGNIVLDYEGDTYHDLVVAGTYKAMRIELKRTDITIGASSNPTIQIDLAKVSFEANNPDRPIEDIVRDSLDFVAHYSDTDSKAITVVVTNEMTAYVKA
ncbi:MAG: phage tail tube protein [Patescibacteria group bacterium]|nr:phage tail tube protein [Patescibacteria group bacterium]